MCEYSGRSYEVFVNKMLQSCCSNQKSKYRLALL
ncbi:hypothetical protein HMPREF0999_00829 [Parabacteroides sp. D25]|nr:hypothetical protein HMPREF0999_00829 [Parabacteroides sp. D25]KMW36445.1 hypothetical protein BSDG_04578 [Parabacteroides sp. 2_1_7]